MIEVSIGEIVQTIQNLEENENYIVYNSLITIENHPPGLRKITRKYNKIARVPSRPYKYPQNTIFNNPVVIRYIMKRRYDKRKIHNLVELAPDILRFVNTQENVITFYNSASYDINHDTSEVIEMTFSSSDYAQLAYDLALKFRTKIPTNKILPSYDENKIAEILNRDLQNEFIAHISITTHGDVGWYLIKDLSDFVGILKAGDSPSFWELLDREIGTSNFNGNCSDDRSDFFFNHINESLENEVVIEVGNQHESEITRIAFDRIELKEFIIDNLAEAYSQVRIAKRAFA